ncbi:MAG: cation:proton antiporter [Candidatus Omnitrophica bacterium CG02_land_8_20_14_3_00__42_8]|nr:MAG: cation:proton antiporter [Candidatus Omnitrophica bacterium CG02_land_8_20_14_3_00__42_8]
MKSKLVLFIFGFIVWSLLTWPLDFQHLVVGLMVVAFVAFITGDLFSRRPHHFGHITRYFWFCYYVPVFLWECLKANIDVALRVLNPKLPINPGIVKVKTTLKSDTGLTFLANSITLTPGTLCVDIDAEKGILYIHWIDVKTQDIDKATQEIVGKFENILKKIFE